MSRSNETGERVEGSHIARAIGAKMADLMKGVRTLMTSRTLRVLHQVILELARRTATKMARAASEASPGEITDVASLGVRLFQTRDTEANKLVFELRELMAKGAVRTLPDAALALGLSTRTLQRDLRLANVGFREERQRLAIDRARELLAVSNDDLDTIAQQVGFASRSHLSHAFRRLTGETPSAARSRLRATSKDALPLPRRGGPPRKTRG